MTSPTRHSHDRRTWRRRLASTLATATAGSVLLVGAPAGSQLASPSRPAAETPQTGLTLVAAVAGHGWRDKPGRRKIVRYTVRRGDTATRLAVRFHAWTAELRALNHLGRAGHLYVGQRIRIPVVVRAVPKKRAHKSRAHKSRAHKARHKPRAHNPRRPWREADASRAKVRRIIVRTARRHGVDPRSALAISWQESGWQQRRRSSAGAIGAMQIMPGTGTWMSMYVDRRLNIYSLRDNVTAGVVLFKVLRRYVSWRRSVAAYYQGLGAVRRHGLYPDTKRYTRNVRALYRRLDRGWDPA